jgi:molecular chaperone GrpE
MKDDPEPSAADGEGRTASVDAPSKTSELEARCADLEARWLRAQADYQNMRRRAQQELDSALFRTLQPLLDELLLVADYLDMALAAPATSAEARSLAAGVELTRSKLAQALELVDVRSIPTSGTFDPALHEAGESRTVTGKAPGTILATTRPGYTWQGRILRPARVIVAAAPGDAQAKAPGEPK